MRAVFTWRDNATEQNACYIFTCASTCLVSRAASAGSASAGLAAAAGADCEAGLLELLRVACVPANLFL